MNEPEELQRVAESLWSFLQTVGFVPGGEHAAWTGKGVFEELDATR